MVSANKLQHGFNDLDSDLGVLENNLGRLNKFSDRTTEEDFRKFVNSVRLLYEARHILHGSVNNAKMEIVSRINIEDIAERKLELMIRKSKNGAPINPYDLAKTFEKTLENFLVILNVQIRYHPSLQRGFVAVQSRVNKRLETVNQLRGMFENPAFNRALLDGNNLAQLKNKLNRLNDNLYPELLRNLVSLDNLIAEFNVRLHNVYQQTSDLDMIKGVKIKSNGFFGKLFGTKDISVPLTGLSNKDKMRISRIQSLVVAIHEVTVKSIRIRQKEILKVIHHIKAEEGDVVSLISKSFGRGEMQFFTRRAA